MRSPKFFRPTHVGMRVLKTALAVGICLTVRWLAGGAGLEYTTIAAVLAMQQSPDKTFSAGIHRLVGTLFGAVGGFFVVSLAQSIPMEIYSTLQILIIPLGLVLVSWLCLSFKQASGVALSCVTYLGIVTNFTTITNTGTFVVGRLLETALGVVVAALVDYFVFPNWQLGSAELPDTEPDTMPDDEV